MKELSLDEVCMISGGVELTDTELSNAYMMSGSVFLPGVATTLLNAYGASITGLPLWGGLATAAATGLATGAGVYLGYQVYHLLYDGS